MLSSLGLAAAICIGCAVLINLNLTPALLVAFPRFFSINGVVPCAPCSRRRPSDKDADGKVFKLSIVVLTTT